MLFLTTEPLLETSVNTTKPPIPWKTFGLALLSLSSLLLALLLQANVFQPYDDEGYVMISLSQFLKGHLLYSDVYTQYGPTYYLGGWLFYKIFGLSVTNDSTRLLNAAGWAITAVVGSLITLRLSGSYIAAILAHLLIFRVMLVGRNEPGHPQVLSIVLLTLAVLMVAFYRGNQRGAWPLFFCGLLGGLLAATKLNLGLYFVLGSLLSLVTGVSLPGTLLLTLIRWLVIGGSMVFIVLLLGSQLAVLEIALFGLSVLAGLAGTILTVRKLLPLSLNLGSLLSAVSGFVAGIALPCLFLLIRGNTLNDLWYGLVKQHIGFESVFPMWTLTSLWQTVLSISVAAGIAYWLKRRGEADRDTVRILSLIKTAVGLFCLVMLLRDNDGVYFTLPLLWLGLLMPAALGERPEIGFARGFLCFMALAEMLWVFPVAGTHVGMAAVLPAILVVLILVEGIEGLESVNLLKSPWIRRGGAIVFTLAALGVGYGWGLAAHAERVALDMPGAKYLVRIYPENRADIEKVVQHLRNHAETFIMVPGMNSFYFWTGKEPPTSLNAGTWMTLLTDEQQRRIIESIVGREKVLVLANPRILKFWVGDKDVAQEPLIAYIRQRFRPMQQFGDYYIFGPR